MVITDRELAAPRPLREVVQLALRGGARFIQVRDKTATPRQLLAQAAELLPLVHGAGGMLIVNDRIDVALAVGADGVHLGPHDLPIPAARRIAPADFIIGASTDDPQRARQLESEGASYLGCGAVFGTTSKDVGAERIGPERITELARSVHIPVVAIGGIDLANVAQLRGTGAAGVAVLSAVMRAAQPDELVQRLLRSFSG